MHQIKWHGIDFIEREWKERKNRCCGDIKQFVASCLWFRRYFCRGGISRHHSHERQSISSFKCHFQLTIAWTTISNKTNAHKMTWNNWRGWKGPGSFSLKEQQWNKKHIFSLHHVHCFRRYVYGIYGSTASNIKLQYEIGMVHIDFVAHSFGGGEAIDSERMRTECFQVWSLIPKSDLFVCAFCEHTLFFRHCLDFFGSLSNKCTYMYSLTHTRTHCLNLSFSCVYCCCGNTAELSPSQKCD